MKIEIGGSAHGPNYGLFIIKHSKKFNWEDGKKYAEKYLDYIIEFHNKKVEKIKSKSGNAYYYIRDGPIIHALEFYTLKKFYPKQLDNFWYCRYRYKAKTNNNPPIFF